MYDFVRFQFLRWPWSLSSKSGSFFRHFAKNSGRTKTQVFDKTQVFFKKLRSQKRKKIPQPQKLWRFQAFYILGVWKFSETQVNFRETQVSFRKTQVWNFEKHTSTANWYQQGRRKSVEKKSLRIQYCDIVAYRHYLQLIQTEPTWLEQHRWQKAAGTGWEQSASFCCCLKCNLAFFLATSSIVG